MPTSDHRSPAPPKPGWRRLVVLVLLTLAAGQLIVANLNESAPLRQGFGADSPMTKFAARRTALTTPVVQLADGRNIQLHFARAPQLPVSADNIADAFYYGLSYDLFPARAYVGDDTQIVNGGPTLARADRVPSDAWLRAHGVAAVVTFPLDAQGLHRPTAIAVR